MRGGGSRAAPVQTDKAKARYRDGVPEVRIPMAGETGKAGRTVAIEQEGVMLRKKLACRALGLNCGFEVHDESEEEIFVVVREHIKRVHQIELGESLQQKAKDLIRFDEGAQA